MCENINKNYSVSGKRAFTLVETLIVIAISSVLMFALAQFFMGYDRSFGFFGATIGVSSSAGMVIVETSAAIMQADKIISSRSFSGTTYASDADSLVLELPSIDSSGNVLAGKHDYIAFYLDETTVYKLTETDGSSSRVSSLRQLSDTAQSLAFSYDDSDLNLAKKIDVDIQTQKQTLYRTAQSHLHQQTYLRNK